MSWQSDLFDGGTKAAAAAAATNYALMMLRFAECINERDKTRTHQARAR
jgi:hypothetical protein